MTETAAKITNVISQIDEERQKELFKIISFYVNMETEEPLPDELEAYYRSEEEYARGEYTVMKHEDWDT